LNAREKDILLTRSRHEIQSPNLDDEWAERRLSVNYEVTVELIDPKTTPFQGTSLGQIEKFGRVTEANRTLVMKE